MHDTLGISRGLIIQSYQHGHSYEYLLHALTAKPGRFRAIASPAPDITDGELEILQQAGIVGMRIRPSVDFDSVMIDRVHEFEWQVHFAVKGEEEIAAWRDKILSVRNRFVLDHMASPPPSKGLDSPEFRFVLDCLETGRCWAKLSPRFSEQETPPFSDVTPFIHVLVDRFPDRLLWGSDWPHPHYNKPMPNDADLLDLMLDWVPDEQVRKRILVDNPAELCRFPPL
jgi:predicted TIM-barrel fold metal-dependent hydrolase